MSFCSCRFWLLGLVLLAVGSPAASAGEPAKPPEVPVVRPVVREVTDYEEFIGRTEASQRVELRSLVSGVLLKAACQEGAEVKKGDLLFEISPVLYKAQLDADLAEVELSKLELKLAQAKHQSKAEVDLAVARVKASEARAELRKVTLKDCKITAPINGRIAGPCLTPGNLVDEGKTILTVLVNDNPLHVSFAIDDRTYLRRFPTRRDETRKLPVAIGLDIEKELPYRGVVDGVEADFKRTIRMRVVLPNPDRRLVAGMLVRGRLALGAPRKALLVVDRAIGSDPEPEFVYVIDADNKVQLRRVKAGPLQPDGLREISEGLKAEDRVVIGRLHVLRPGMTVRPQAAEMPVLQRPKPAEGAPSRQEKAALPRRQGGSGIIVEATSPGVSAEVVSEMVRIPIEREVNPLEKLEYLRSRCTSDGKYALTLAFAPGMDLWRAQMLVQNRLGLAMPLLPAEVRNAGVNVQRGTSGVLMLVNLYSVDDKFDRLFLSNYAIGRIKDWLARRPGVGEVTLLGGSELRMNVWLNPDRLAAYRLNVGDVTRVLAKKKMDRNMRPESLADLPVRENDMGEVLRVRDVARVELGAGPLRSLASLDGKPAVTLAVRLTGEVSPRKVAGAVRDVLAFLHDDFPPGLNYDMSFDFTANLEGARPSAASEYLLVDLDLPAGATDRSARILEQSEKVLRPLPGVEHVLALSENPFDPFGGPPCVLVQLHAAQQRKTAREEVIKSIRTKLGKTEAGTVRVRDFSAPGAFPRCGYPIDLALRGPDLAQVQLWSARLADKLKQSNKLMDTWVDHASVPRPAVSVDIDRRAVAARGVDLDEITRAIDFYSGPLPVNTFVLFDRIVPVEVQVNPGAGAWPRNLDVFRVINREGQMVPLAALVKVRRVHAPAVLDFLNLYPMVEITANLEPGVSLDQGRKLCTQLADEVRREMGLPAGYRLTWLR
jgi:RND family efflux transporter MFP subunit